MAASAALPVSDKTAALINYLGFKDNDKDGIIKGPKEYYTVEADLDYDGSIVELELKYYLHFVANADPAMKADYPLSSEELRDISLRMIDTGEYEAALEITNTIDAFEIKFEAMGNIINKMLEAGSINQALDAIPTLMETLQLIDSNLFPAEKQDGILDPIIDQLLKLGCYDEAAVIAQEIKFLYARETKYNSILYAVDEHGNFKITNELSANFLLNVVRDYSISRGIRYKAVQLLEVKLIIDPALTKELIKLYKDIYLKSGCLDKGCGPAAYDQLEDVSGVDAILNALHRALINNGSPDALPFLIKIGKTRPKEFVYGNIIITDQDTQLLLADDLLIYAIQLDRKGRLTKHTFNILREYCDDYKYNLEYGLLNYLVENKGDTILTRYAKQTTAAIERQRNTRPVSVISLKRAELYDPEQAPKTKQTYAYDLKLRMLKTPQNASSATLYIIDPQNNYWPQNCDDSGAMKCEVFSNDENIFRVFLNTGNKSVRAYIRYYDYNGKHIASSNYFTITNPDAKDR